jgi:hypothetical protein
MNSDDEMIRRGDVLAAVLASAPNADAYAYSAIAALPAAKLAVKVRPLVWRGDADFWMAPAPLFGRIRVEPYGRDGTFTVSWSVPGYSDWFINGAEYPTPEAAKAAAQAHYDARILAALAVQPAPDVAALVEALQNAMGHIDTPVGRRKLGVDADSPWIVTARATLAKIGGRGNE